MVFAEKSVISDYSQALRSRPSVDEVGLPVTDPSGHPAQRGRGGCVDWAGGGQPALSGKPLDRLFYRCEPGNWSVLWDGKE